MGGITAFLIVKDEERLLPRLLESLSGIVDAIVALDCGSRDATPRLLEAAAARPDGPPLLWRRHAFAGFGPARAEALAMVRTPWALWLDADELPSEELRARLRELRHGGELESCDAWELPLTVRVRGRAMRARGLAGQRKLRLFRSEGARISDSAVHEGIVLPAGARVGRLAEPLYHDTLTVISRYLRKVELYTRLETGGTGRPNAGAAPLPPARRLLLPLHLLVTMPATWWREWAWRGAWRDGPEGLLWAGITAWGSWRRDLAYLRQGWPRARRSRS